MKAVRCEIINTSIVDVITDGLHRHVIIMNKMHYVCCDVCYVNPARRARKCTNVQASRGVGTPSPTQLKPRDRS